MAIFTRNSCFNIGLLLCLQFLVAFSIKARSIDDYKPTVFEVNPFAPTADAKILETAMKGFGVDDKAIVEILALRGNVQRLEIAEAYTKLYNESLVRRLKSELRGSLEDLIIGMMTPLPDYYAEEIYDAAHRTLDRCGRVENDAGKILELFSGLDSNQLKIVSNSYEKLFNKTLREDMVGIIPPRYFIDDYWESGHVSAEEIGRYYAKRIYNAINARIVDRRTLNRIIITRSEFNLETIKEEYEKLYGKSLHQALSEVLSKVKNTKMYYRAIQYLLGGR